nr:MULTISPECIES: hypothetical protein [unclassified Kocuria]
MSVTKGLLVRLEALPGKEDEVQEFLGIGRGLVEEEPATVAWFAIRLGPSGPPPSFGPVAVRVVGFRLMGALPSVVDGCEVAER